MASVSSRSRKSDSRETKHAKTGSGLEPGRASLECDPSVPRIRSRDQALRPGRHRLFAGAGRRLALVGGDPYELEDESGLRDLQGEEEFNRRVLGVPHMLARAADDESLAGRFHFVPHHRAHAASAFYASPFPRAAILVVDGIGEESTAWLGRGSPRV